MRHRIGLSALGLFALVALAACARQPAAVVAPAADAPEVRILNASYYTAIEDPALKAYVKTTAEAAFASHCASCHGPDMKGKSGVPDLTDADTLWGWGGTEETDNGNMVSLEQTILYGLRNQDCPDTPRKQTYGACPDTRYSSMAGFVKLTAITEAQADDLADYVLSLGGAPAGTKIDARAIKRAAPLFALNCVECHASDGYGVKPYGGPNLTDDVWLYGSDRATIRDIIANGRAGACPAWQSKLDAATIKALAVYLYGKAQEAL